MIKNEGFTTYMFISITMYVLYIQTDEAKEFYTAAAGAYLAKPYGERDAGFDLASVDCVVSGSGVRISQQTRAALYDTKLNVFRAYWMLPRSSISKTPLRLANSVGLIDAGYRGMLLAAVDNRGAEPFTVRNGDRLFQISTPDLLPFDDIRIVDEIPGGATLRGSGGFGSTGVSYFT
jgi:dUTP pyrophosphatase